MSGLKRIGLGGGCHWCTEGVFVSLAGVHRVEQGWISSVAPDGEPSEAVIAHYDPTQISSEVLIRVHLETHASTSAHGLRDRYRSAVYSFSQEEEAIHRAELGAAGGEGVVTRVLPFVSFTGSLPEHQDYYRKAPHRPFCRRYITPKLDRLRKDRPELFLANKQ